MKTVIVLYSQCALFETVLVSYFMKTAGEVATATGDGAEAVTAEGICVRPDLPVSEIQPEETDVLVICGGPIENIGGAKTREYLRNLISRMNREGKVVGAICAGRMIAAEALGIQPEEIPEHTIRKGNLVLSPGNEYADFALETGRAAGIYKDEADYLETVQYFKYFRA